MCTPHRPTRTKHVTPALLSTQENLLVEWILYLAGCGFPVSKDQLLDCVEVLVKQLKKANHFNLGGIGTRVYEKTSATTKEQQDGFPKLLNPTNENAIHIQDILNDPSRVF